MAVGKQIKVTLTLDENGFGSKTKAAAASLEQLGKAADTGSKSIQRIDNHLTSFGAKAHRMIMTLGMVRFALMDVNDIFLKLPLVILKTGGEIERLTKLMEGLSTQTDVAAKKLEAASNVKFLFNMAQNAPFEIKALADSFVKLKTGGLDPTKGALQSLVDGVAKFGGSSEQLKRASIAIQQMGGKGVISMEELRQQLGEAVPTAMRAMADGMGLTMAELTKAVSKGSVASASAMNKMLVVMGLNNAGAAAAMMTTWVGMIERLKTKWELFKLEIGSAGMFDTAKAALEDLIKGFGAASTGSLARDIGRWLNDAVINVVALTKQIIELWDWIKNAGQAFAIYWVASKVAGPLMAAAKAVNDMRNAVVLNSRATLQAVADEGVARQRDAAARALHLRDWMAGNAAQITAERARVLARKHRGRRHSA
ncbi:tape measure protein [Polaromonas sp. P1(28)-13]|nr:tape measure protein [Polaromonas sp. P1(28)-13]